MKRTWTIILVLLLLAAPAAVQAQFSYTNADNSIYDYSTNADGVSVTITAYTGPPWTVLIPTNINGLLVASIGDWSFYGTDLTSVTVPDSVTRIGNYAFYSCTSLTSVTVTNSVIKIGEYAFWGTGLANATIPASVTSIGDFAFLDCTNLTAIVVDEHNLYFSSYNGVLFDYSQENLLQCPAGFSGGFTIPGSVTNIGQQAFVGCTGLTSVTIPNSVTSIGDSAFSGCTNLTSVTIPGSVANIGMSAFASCPGLTAFTVDPTNSFYSSVNGVLFDKTQTTLLDYPGGLGGSYSIPGSVTSIGIDAFEACQSLTSVTIPNSVTSIGESSFEGCTGLTSVTIPNSVTNLGTNAFFYCTNLTGVYFTGNAPSVDSSVFRSDNKLEVYYLPGTTAWNAFATNSVLTPVLWNPGIPTGDGVFGVHTNYFGFKITNAANLTVVVEACTNLASPVWVPLATNTLANGVFYFNEPFQANRHGRFYGLGLP